MGTLTHGGGKSDSECTRRWAVPKGPAYGLDVGLDRGASDGPGASGLDHREDGWSCHSLRRGGLRRGLVGAADPTVLTPCPCPAVSWPCWQERQAGNSSSPAPPHTPEQLSISDPCPLHLEVGGGPCAPSGPRAPQGGFISVVPRGNLRHWPLSLSSQCPRLLGPPPQKLLTLQFFFFFFGFFFFFLAFFGPHPRHLEGPRLGGGSEL